MKKTVNKFLVVMVVFVLCLTPIQMSAGQPYVSDCETASPFDLLAAERGVEFATNYVRTLTMLNNFIDSLPVSRTGELMFPDYFGGAYIDDDGNAVLLMVNMPVAPPVLESRDAAHKPISAHIEQMQTSEGVAVREVEFAYSDLWAAIHALNDLIPPTSEDMAAVNAGGWHLDVIGNRVVVELIDFTEDAENVFREAVLDAPMLVFKQSPGPVMLDLEPVELDYWLQEYVSYDVDFDEMSIAPFNTLVASTGGAIDARRDGVPTAGGSIGFRASLGGRRGFVTAAHIGRAFGGMQAGISVYVPGRQHRIGHVASMQHFDLFGTDAVFVTLEPDAEIRNNAGGTTIGTQVTHLFVGQEIGAAGRASPPRTGRVTAVGRRATFGDVMGFNFTVENAMVSTITVASGDSGGIVFDSVSGCVVGIQVGPNAGHNVTPVVAGGGSVTSVVSEINRRLGTTVRP